MLQLTIKCMNVFSYSLQHLLFLIIKIIIIVVTPFSVPNVPYVNTTHSNHHPHYYLIIFSIYGYRASIKPKNKE